MQNSNNQNKQIAMLGADKYKMAARDVVLPYAIASLRQQAGYVASKMPVTSSYSSQRETQPYCTDTAANYLRDMLEGTHTFAREEWVLLLSQTRQLAPPEYLPMLLELGKEDKFFRPYIVRVGGNRIFWLAQQADSSTAHWVTEVANNLSDYLRKAHAEASQEDAILIGTLGYQVKHSEPKYTDSRPEAQRCTLPIRGGLIDEYTLSLYDLYRATGLWSAMLSEAFMEGAYLDFFNRIDSPQFAYRLSLQIERKRLQAWQNVMCRRFHKSSEVLQQTMPIIEYRRNMRQAIEVVA